MTLCLTVSDWLGVLFPLFETGSLTQCENSFSGYFWTISDCLLYQIEGSLLFFVGTVPSGRFSFISSFKTHQWRFGTTSLSRDSQLAISDNNESHVVTGVTINKQRFLRERLLNEDPTFTSVYAVSTKPLQFSDRTIVKEAVVGMKSNNSTGRK